MGFYALLLIVILVIVALVSKSIESHHSNWNTLIDNFDYSTKEFCNLLNTDSMFRREVFPIENHSWHQKKWHVLIWAFHSQTNNYLDIKK